jgi:hypothetical protein
MLHSDRLQAVLPGADRERDTNEEGQHHHNANNILGETQHTLDSQKGVVEMVLHFLALWVVKKLMAVVYAR